LVLRREPIPTTDKETWFSVNILFPQEKDPPTVLLTPICATHTNVKESFQYANVRFFDIFTSALGFTIAAIGAQAFIQPTVFFAYPNFHKQVAVQS
jgi:hypothetical protein